MQNCFYLLTMVFKITLVVVCFTYVAFATLDTGVAGGTSANIEQFPFISALNYYYPRPDMWVQRCIGTVISSWHIITSAECFRGAKLSNLRIRAGSTYSMSDGQVTTIKAVTLHPEYVELPRKNNIAVVLLQEPLKIGSTLNFLTLPSPNAILPVGLQTTVVIWGSEDESEQGPIHDSLQAISSTTASLDECKTVYAEDEDVEINDSVVCAAGASTAARACGGHSGAPLVQGSVLVGVSSYKECGDGHHPAVFTRVDAYTDWIMEVAVAPTS